MCVFACVRTMPTNGKKKTKNKKSAKWEKIYKKKQSIHAKLTERHKLVAHMCMVYFSDCECLYLYCAHCSWIKNE